MTYGEQYEALLRERLAEGADQRQFVEELSGALVAVENRLYELHRDLARARILMNLVREKWGLPEVLTEALDEGPHGEWLPR